MAAKKSAEQQQPAELVKANVPTLAMARALEEVTDGQPVEHLPGSIGRFADTDERTMVVVHKEGVLFKQELAEEAEG